MLRPVLTFVSGRSLFFFFFSLRPPSFGRRSTSLLNLFELIFKVGAFYDLPPHQRALAFPPTPPTVFFFLTANDAFFSEPFNTSHFPLGAPFFFFFLGPAGSVLFFLRSALELLSLLSIRTALFFF